MKHIAPKCITPKRTGDQIYQQQNVSPDKVYVLGQNLSATKGIGRQSIWGQNVSGQNETADRKYKQRET
jgi:hypothetical protein